MNSRAREIRERLAELDKIDSEIIVQEEWQPVLYEYGTLCDELEKIENMTEEEYVAYAEEKRRKKEELRRELED